MKNIIKAMALFLAVIFCISSPTTALASEQFYITFFSTEREFFTEEMIESQNTHNYVIEDGNLYSVQYEPTRITTLLIENGNITDFAVSDNKLFFISENKIYSSNWDATEISLVYTLPDSIDGEIDWIYPNDDIVWFNVDSCIYRLYRPTNTLDFVFSNDDMIWWRAVSNYCIVYDVYSEEYLKAIEDGIYDDGMPIHELTRYKYSSYACKSCIEYWKTYASEKLTKEVQTRTVTHYASYSTTIAGKEFPRANIP